MERSVVFFFLLFFQFSLYSQSIPSAHQLSRSPYYFGAWSEKDSAGTYPESMMFQEYLAGEEPGPNSEPVGDWLCTYDITSRSRFVGMGEWGIGMVNTGSEQDDTLRCGNAHNLGGRVGVVTIALNTEASQSIELSWKVRMVKEGDGYPTPREYRLSAQYRLSAFGEWINFPSSTTYNTTGKVAGDMQEFFVQLPAECENQPFVQVRWKYFQQNSHEGGSRPFISLDDIKVVGQNTSSVNQPFVFVSKSSLRYLNCVKNQYSEVDSIYVSGVYLNGNVKFATGGNFYISLNKNVGYTQEIELYSYNGILDERIIYVKSFCDTAAVKTSNLNITSEKVSQRIPLRGEGYSIVKINELMSSNFDAYYDAGLRDYPDWIELYNPDEEIARLRGFFMTDNLDDPKKFAFGLTHTIPTKSFRMYYPIGEVSTNASRMNFSLSTNGETVYLLGKDARTIIDSVSFPSIESNHSYGREVDGEDKWVVFGKSTPNATNAGGELAKERSNIPVFSHKGGKYAEEFLLTLSAQHPDAKIYYTIDGSEPSMDDLGGFVYEYKQSYPRFIYSNPTEFYYRPYRTYFYSEPINMSTYRNKSFWLSDINMRHASAPYFLENKRDHGTIIRAIAVEPGKAPSKVVTHSYFFGDDNFVNDHLPIISLVVSENDLIGYYDGISVAGIDYETWRYKDSSMVVNGNTPANYQRSGRGAEIKANIELFKYDRPLNQLVGLRIHGATSRAAIYKSFRLYPRKYYGEDAINYPIFKNLPYDDYRRLIVRNTGNSRFQTYFKDAFLQRLITKLGLDYQEYQPNVLYLNGEFWGIYDFRERIEVNFFQRKYGFDEGKIDYIKGFLAQSIGDNKQYKNLYDMIEQDSMMSNDTYVKVKEMMDVNNYVDYYSFLIYVANMDWPFNNIGAWRYKVDKLPEKAPYGLDGRFRWVVFDLDHGFYYENVNYNNLLATIKPIINVGAEWSVVMFRNLLNHDEFKNLFITRHSDLLNTYFKPERVIGEIQYYKNLLEKDMPNQFKRWQNKTDISDWYTNISLLEKFASERPDFCRQHMKEIFSLKNLKQITLDVDDIHKGFIHINTIDIDTTTPGVNKEKAYPWSGVYFDDLPVRLIPMPRDGYKFSYWEFPDSTSYIDTIRFDLKRDLWVKAHFEIDDNYIYHPEPAIITDCPFEFKEWAPKHKVGEMPEHMAFYYTRFPDSKYNGQIDGMLEDIRFDHDAQTRINGLGQEGISFVNAGGANDNYYPTRLGAMAIGFRTIDIEGVLLSFTAGTVKPQSKKYNLRLQYRFSDKGDFYDFLDKNGQVVEYHGSTIKGHSQRFENIELPAEFMGRKYVQLAWRYYYNGEQLDLSSNARDEIRIDDIVIQQKDIVRTISNEVYSKTLVANANSQSFQWYVCQNDTLTPLQNETKRELVIKTPGYYAVEVDYGECKHLSDCEFFDVKEHKEFVASIHTSVVPNPSNGDFDLIFDEEISNARIRILDVSGRTMQEGFYEKIKMAKFSLGNLSNGVYILDITTKEGRNSSQKVILQR